MKMNGREDRALSAILVLAYLEELSMEVPVLTGPEPTLVPEDERAIQDLGPDLVQRILEEGARQ
jgi:hypothetical protein